MRRTVTFRLTVWYAALSAVLSLAFVVILDLALTASLRQRTDRALHDEARRLAAWYRTRGLRSLRDEFAAEAELSGTTRVFYVLFSPGLETLAASDLTPWREVAFRAVAADVPAAVGAEVCRSLPVPHAEHGVRVLARRVADGGALEVATTLEEDEELRESYWRIAGAVLTAMLVGGGLIGWFVATRAMAGVRRVTEAATRTGRDDLARRVPILGDGAEIDDLATAFNDMLGRIQTLVAEMEEVTNNVAHELRSPLTRIRGVAESALTAEPSAARCRDLAGAVVEECDRLVGMVNTMLEIATTEAGVAAPVRAEVDLAAIARDAVELFQPVAEDRQISLALESGPGRLCVHGDRARLQRVLANLLDNAIKYTPARGTVTVALSSTPAEAIVRVADTGTGIAAEDLPHVFERFYRVDRSRSTPGHGLGLSLARSIVRAHGGEVAVDSALGRGSTFSVRLPLSRSPAAGDPGTSPQMTKR